MLRRASVWTVVLMAAALTLGPAARAAGAVGPDPVARALEALDALVAHREGQKTLSAQEAKRAATLVRAAVSRLPAGDRRLRPRLAELRRRYAEDLVPTPRRPLRSDNPLGRLLLALQVADLRTLPPERVRAHPAAAVFPGAVPASARRVRRILTVDTATWGWHSTGLYAPPGALVRVFVPAEAADKGLVVRIGCHRDRLWHHAAWRRVPEICTRRPIERPETRIASAFGGPVYIEVPRGFTLGKVRVIVSGAVEMPFYEHGRTDLEAWRSRIRNRPAPWAELASSKIVLTVPARVVRGLDRPDLVMDFWDRVADACADLAARPRERSRPERYVTDVQIAAGYMHSGYPIMTGLDVAPVLVNVDRMKRNAHGGVWGLFHELGHNHQSRDWTFGGTGEVTVNLFTMYVLETVCGLEPTRGHGAISDRARAAKMRAYFADPDFEKWKRDPFLALIMYIQLKEAFGWEAFKRVFAEYRALPAEQRPRTDAERRDQWLVRLSRTVGRNLGPFFEAWRVPTSEAARQAVADLPVWMPEGFPPAARSAP